MANKEVVTFYLYNSEGVLATKTKKIYSPYQTYIAWRYSKNDGYYEDPKFITFEGGVYETSDEEEISWLDMYNPEGWTVEQTIDGRVVKKHWGWDRNHQAKRDKPKDKQNEITIEKEVEVHRLPMTVLDGFTVEMLKWLCESWNVAIDWAIKKEDYIKLLRESNHISD